MNKFNVLRAGAVLFVAGIAIAMVGFLFSGANPHAYEPYTHRWYSVIHLGD